MTRGPGEDNIGGINEFDLGVVAWQVEDGRIVEYDPGGGHAFVADQRISVVVEHLEGEAVNAFGKFCRFVVVAPAEAGEVEVVGIEVFCEVFAVEELGNATTGDDDRLWNEAWFCFQGDAYTFDGDAEFAAIFRKRWVI